MPDRAKQLIGKNGQLTGLVETHRLDVIIGNGKPLAAVQALSFEGGDTWALQRDVDSTAWLIEDVKRRHKILPIGVFCCLRSVLPKPSIVLRSYFQS